MAEDFNLLDILKIISPGTTIRTAIEDLVRARLGALIVFYTEKLNGLFEGGFRINTKLTPQRLVELCKMDGAIIITPDRKKILYANTLLVPDKNFLSNETGTRHKAAERTAKQAETITIAVSERKNKVTIYYKDIKYVLRSTEELLRRATETLQILEKQREIYDNLLANLNILEITNLVTIRDVCIILQKIETIVKISENIHRYILELGREGGIIKMRFRELTLNIEETEKQIVKDYVKMKFEKTKQILYDLSFDSLLEIQSISNLLFLSPPEERISPRGYRFLKNTSLTEDKIKEIGANFFSLEEILNSDRKKIVRVLGTEEQASLLFIEIEKIKDQIIAGKKF